MKTASLLLAFLLLIASPAFAQEMTFGWPAACTVGEDCWVVHYLDHAPSPGISDFNCGHLTYEGHDGTDIAIRDRNQHVDVVAAADGVVMKTRNDQRDHDGGKTNTDPTREAHTECGNAVTIQHENGWRSFYCHMKQGSVVVQPGQTVAKGDKLGEVGQSGLADFPHVHLEILKGKTSIDPFTGDAVGEFTGACGTGAGAPLWDHAIPYDPVMLYASGFSQERPEYESKSKDTASPEVVSSTTPFLFFWFLGIGGEPGDHIQIQVTDPSGKVIADSDTQQQKTQIRIMYFAGVRNKTGHLRPGLYHGIAMLTRVLADGQTIQKKIEHSVSVQ